MAPETNTTQGRRYRAFIAYSHSDERWAAWLHRRLESYRVPRRLVGQHSAIGAIPRRLGPIFRDREELATSESLSEHIDKALAQSDALIVICSPTASRSRWVNEEIRRFKACDGARPVLCLIVAGKPAAPDSQEGQHNGCFPPTLHAPTEAPEATKAHGAEPVAADLRPGGDGRALSLLKIIAGLLDVGLDELRRREQHRRHRRLLAVTVAAVLLAGITSTLAMEALVSRHAAVTARDAAERQRAQAEDLVSFMLGKLQSELAPIGKLSLLDMIAKRTLAYYQRQDPATLDARSLDERATALRLIGHVYDARGDTDHALLAFQQAANTTARLLAQSPNDPTRLYAHELSVFYVAMIYYRRGQYERALREYRREHELVRRLVTLAPNNLTWQSELEATYANLGTMFQKQGKPREAQRVYLEALPLATKLAAGHPDDKNALMNLAQTHAWLADAEQYLGNLDEAWTQRTTEFEIYKRLLAMDPTDTNVQEAVITNRRRFAQLSLAHGKLASATKFLETAQEIAYSLLRLDPTNKTWQQDDGDVCVELGELLYYRHQPAARTKAAEAEGLALSLIARDSTVRDWQLLLGRAWLLKAMLAARAGDHHAALELTQHVVHRLKALPANHHQDDETTSLLARAQLRLGDELHKAGRDDAARRAWRAALTNSKPNGRARRLRTLTVAGLAAERLGLLRQAHAIVTGLRAKGYRAPSFVELRDALSQRAATEGANGDR